MYLMSNDHTMVVTAKPPNACGIEDLNAFQQFVLAGGEVNADTLPGLVTRALSLAFVRIGEQLVAVGAIKRPNAGYRAGIFDKAGVKQDPTQFEFELGWIYVDPSVRGKGIASAVVEVLVHTLHGARAYATSRVNNEPMHTSLMRYGFTPIGSPYPSQLNEPNIQLFLCE